jgi:hypothetical protein
MAMDEKQWRSDWDLKIFEYVFVEPFTTTSTLVLLPRHIESRKEEFFAKLEVTLETHMNPELRSDLLNAADCYVWRMRLRKNPYRYRLVKKWMMKLEKAVRDSSEAYEEVEKLSGLKVLRISDYPGPPPPGIPRMAPDAALREVILDLDRILSPALPSGTNLLDKQAVNPFASMSKELDLILNNWNENYGTPPHRRRNNEFDDFVHCLADMAQAAGAKPAVLAP